MSYIAEPYDSPAAPQKAAKSYREERAAREQRLKLASNEAVARQRESVNERESLELRVGDLAAGLLLGEVTEAEVAEAERDLTEAVAAERRWALALRGLDYTRGISRDMNGTIIS